MSSSALWRTTTRSSTGDRRLSITALPRASPSSPTGRPRAVRWAPASANRWRRRATSTATDMPTSSSGPTRTTTAKPTKGGRSSTSARPRVCSSSPPPGPPRAIRRGVASAGSYDNGQTDEGRAYVYLGSASGPALLPAWAAESDQANALFGYSVATAGDVTGDGYSDVVVGARDYDNGLGAAGRAFVYHGSATGLAASPAWTADGGQASAEFGVSVATAGDVNGDGYSDVIVGADLFDNGEQNEGRAFVYHGSPSGLAGIPAWTGEPNRAGAKFGVSVATAGDVNGDGYSDVIVGAQFYSNVETLEGLASVYLGSATGLAGSPAWTAEGNQVNAFLGASVATAGDVNGDGYSDVVVGAHGYSNGEQAEGRVFVYH